jgi:hypothetical protein
VRDLRPIPQAEALWRGNAFGTTDEVASGLANGQIDLLGTTWPYPPPDWHDEHLERLRLFHLHCGEEILGSARAGSDRFIEAARNGLDAWITRNPAALGDGWHPYPLSTRVGNWIAACSLEPALASPRLAASVASQLAYLGRNVEDEILGNHVIRNARALVLGGAATGDTAAFERGLDLLERELPEQVLQDGGHYERSPVYHVVVLRDLMEIAAVSRSPLVESVVARMRDFAAAAMRPDGRPALFNDSPLALAPCLEDLPVPKQGLDLRPYSGYAFVRADKLWLAFDCGSPAPNFLPAHAHADALSFQLWFDGTPVVVDPGMPTYELGRKRNWFRGTRAHATVCIDGRDQFEMWDAFRSGPFPDIELLDASGDRSEGMARGRVAGIPGLRGVVHTRELRWTPTEVVVEDLIEGSGERTLESALPLPPGTMITANRLVVAGLAIEAFGPLKWSVEQRVVAETLFDESPAPAVVLRGTVRPPVRFGWRFQALHE